MRLSRKVLFTISLPLAFQLAVSVFLFLQVRNAEAKIEAEIQRKRIVASLDDIHRLHVKSLAMAAFFSVSKDPELGTSHLDGLKQLAKQIKRLTELTRGDEELTNLTVDLRDKILAVIPFEIMMRKLSLMESKPQIAQSTKARELIRDSMRSIEEFQTKLMPPQDELDAFKKSALGVELALGLAVLMGIALSMSLFFWWQLGVLNRVRLLTQEVQQFKDGRVPVKQLEDEDEISDLEKTICHSAERIINLENLRRELCSIVAHDVRAPMTSIDGLLTLLESGAFGQLNDTHQKLLGKLKRISTDLLTLLTEILDLDKLRAGKWTFSISTHSFNEILDELAVGLREAGFDVNETSQAEGNLNCDPDALVRAVKSVAIAFRSEDDSGRASSALSLRAAGAPALRNTDVSLFVENGALNVRLVKDIETPTPKQQSSIALAKLFVEGQKLEFSVDTTGGAIVLSIREPSTIMQPSSPHHQFSALGRKLLPAVSLPMGISAAAVLLIGVQLNQAGQSIHKEFVSREIIHLATNLTADMTQLMLLSIRRMPGELKEEGPARAKVIERLDRNMTALAALEGGESPEEVARFKDKVEKIKALSATIVASPMEDMAGTMKTLATGDAGVIWKTSAGEAIAQREQQESQETKLLSTSRVFFTNVLIAAGFVLAIATILTSLQINKTFLQRLKNVSENASRLTRREPLNKPDKGDDEIADLDAFFYEVAQNIARLESERQEMSRLLREDLKAPLISIEDRLNKLLAEADELAEKGRNRTRNTLLDLKRLQDLVDDLLLLDTLDEEGGLKIDLSVYATAVQDIITRAVDAVLPAAEMKKIEIKAEKESPHMVIADASRCIQIIVNLLSNAIKFSEEKSTITVSINDLGDKIKIEVIDKGRGIDESEFGKVFARFDQMNCSDQAKGSGLGLFISKKLAEYQGGTLDFKSTKGEGSTFYLILQKAN